LDLILSKIFFVFFSIKTEALSSFILTSVILTSVLNSKLDLEESYKLKISLPNTRKIPESKKKTKNKNPFSPNRLP